MGVGRIANLTVNDWELVEKAKALHYSDNRLIEVLIEKADTEIALRWMLCIWNYNQEINKF